jgi:acyl-CoA synthetase (AMP-forming)/AMP-acid ligase II/pimeloyl-ACP methyl ester carboxylesterase
LSPLKFSSHFVDIDIATGVTGSMHYLDEGVTKIDKPTVLLLHGNPTWCYYYRNLIDDLKDEARVIAPDWIGCGLSTSLPGRVIRLSDRIDHLIQFVTRLKLEDITLVMHDWGGPIGSGFAVKYPHLIKEIVYLNTTLTEVSSLPPIIRYSATLPFGRLLTKYTNGFIKLTTSLGVKKALPKTIREGYLYPYTLKEKRGVIADFVEDIPLSEKHPSFNTLKELGDGLGALRGKPVKIIWGMKDICFHPGILDKLAKNFPQAEIVKINNASHLVLEDAPEEVIREIRQFILPSEKKEISLTPSNKSSNSIYETFLHNVKNSSEALASITIDKNLLGKEVTFGEFGKRVFNFERGLSELNLLPKERVLFLSPINDEVIALSLAVIGRGGIPVFVDPGIGIKRLRLCIEKANCVATVLSPKARLLYSLIGRNEKLKFVVITKERSILSKTTLNFFRKYSTESLPPLPLSEEAPALIAFTSGATGVPKGVVYTHKMMLSQLLAFRETLEVPESGRGLSLLPLFSLYDILLGNTAVFPNFNNAKPMTLDEAYMTKVIKDFRVTHSFGSPTLWNKLATYILELKGEKVNLRENLQRIYLIGAPVSDAVLEKVGSLIDKDRVSTPYGSTESLPISNITASTRLTKSDGKAFSAVTGEFGTPIGRPFPNTLIKVVKIQEGPIKDLTPLQAGEIGELIVAGSQISPEYYNDPLNNSLFKVFDKELYHRVGDLCYLDEDNGIYFCGRKNHMVLASLEDGTIKPYYSIPTERAFLEHSGVARAALVSLYTQQSTKVAGMVIEPKKGEMPKSISERESFIAELQRMVAEDPIANTIKHFFFKESFPVDGRHNAKIFRDQLSVWAGREFSLQGH